MSTHKVCFHEEITITIPRLSSNTLSCLFYCRTVKTSFLMIWLILFFKKSLEAFGILRTKFGFLQRKIYEVESHDLRVQNRLIGCYSKNQNSL